MRLTNEELENIKKKYGVKTIWSWSRLEKARQSKNEFYLTYVKHIQEDRTDCVYGTMGGLCHDTLEKLYEKQIQYDEMLTYFDENWSTAIDIMDLKFDRNDSEKNRSIGSKYKENLEHFFMHHTPIQSKDVSVEEFILTKWDDDIIFQGYADCIFKDKEKFYHIIDFKTSTKYSPSTMKEKCGQLVNYALGFHQLGVSIDRIKIAWNFLKYATVKYTQSTGKMASRDIERRDIGLKLQTNAKMWLKKLGYEENQINKYTDELIKTNSIDCLPEDVREKFEITDCYVYVPLTQELIDYWKQIVKETVEEIENLTKEYEKRLTIDPTHAEEVWIDSLEDVEKESYYYATLSGYSANLNISYKRYLEALDAKKNGIDRFNSVGSDIDDNELLNGLFDNGDNNVATDNTDNIYGGSNANCDNSIDSGNCNNDSGNSEHEEIRVPITVPDEAERILLEAVINDCNNGDSSSNTSNNNDNDDLDMSWLNDL